MNAAPRGLADAIERVGNLAIWMKSVLCAGVIAFLLGVFRLPAFASGWLVQGTLTILVLGIGVLCEAARRRVLQQVGGAPDIASSPAIRTRLRESRWLTILFVVCCMAVISFYVPMRTRGFAETRAVAASAKLATLAIRLSDAFDQYVAQHDGKVPASLEAMTVYFPEDEAQELLARSREAFIYVPPPTAADGETEGIAVTRSDFGGIGRLVVYTKLKSEFVFEKDLPTRLTRAVNDAANANQGR